MEATKPTKLAIGGKVISIEKIGDKTLNQFKQQLKQKGLQISDGHAELVYSVLKGGINRIK